MKVNQKKNIAKLKKINGRINKNIKDVKVIQKSIGSLNEQLSGLTKQQKSQGTSIASLKKAISA